ncbi:LolA family protein [Acanthopleuribacter pedis]|uniref:DUF4412 domain-containing protein n=1 Tax=Acanthopleuribacter pedis TaxID=442870 RepID=A0A8J7QB15_9BACT|nr:hypothetical protein [Acanthopleuribacter pedis]MBO1322201.1 hypothetical protein [Acanthopleuribacter pedis]
MKKSLKCSLVALLCATFLLLPLHAGSDAKSAEWLEKMAKAYANMPYSLNYTGAMTVNQMGQEISMKMDGKMIAKDQTHQNMTMKMTMNTPAGPMDMNALYVLDGRMMWTEMKMPPQAGGMTQVTKLSLEAMEKMNEEMGFGGMGMQGPMDPAQMVKNMEKTLDITFKGIADGKVTMQAEMTEEAAKKMGMAQPGTPVKGMKMTLILDEKNIWPTTMKMEMEGPEGQKMPFEFNFNDFKKLDKVDDALFTYTAPEGAMVIDGDQMMKQQQQMKEGDHGHDHSHGDHGHKHD